MNANKQDYRVLKTLLDSFCIILKNQYVMAENAGKDELANRILEIRSFAIKAIVEVEKEAEGVSE